MSEQTKQEAGVVYPVRPRGLNGRTFYQIAAEDAPRPVCGYTPPGADDYCRGPIYPRKAVAVRAAGYDFETVRVSTRYAEPPGPVA